LHFIMHVCSIQSFFLLILFVRSKQQNWQMWQFIFTRCKVGKISLLFALVHLPEDDNWGRLVLELRLLPKMDRRTYCERHGKETERKMGDYKLFSVFRGKTQKNIRKSFAWWRHFVFEKKKFVEKGTLEIFMAFARQHWSGSLSP
jgi:hypothetical protein